MVSTKPTISGDALCSLFNIPFRGDSCCRDVDLHALKTHKVYREGLRARGAQSLVLATMKTFVVELNPERLQEMQRVVILLCYSLSKGALKNLLLP